jgi:hypothetical protein
MGGVSTELRVRIPTLGFGLNSGGAARIVPQARSRLEYEIRRRMHGVVESGRGYGISNPLTMVATTSWDASSIVSRLGKL